MPFAAPTRAAARASGESDIFQALGDYFFDLFNNPDRRGLAVALTLGCISLAAAVGMLIPIVRSATDQESRISATNRAISAGLEGDTGAQGSLRQQSPMSDLFPSQAEAPIVAGAVPPPLRPTVGPFFGLFGPGLLSQPAGPTPGPASAGVGRVATAQPSGSPPTQLVPASPAASTGRTLIVSGTQGGGAILRSGPSPSEPIIRIWPDGTQMIELGLQQTADGTAWANVRAPDGSIGWVVAGFLASGPSRPSSPATQTGTQPAPVDPASQATLPPLATGVRSSPTPRPSFTPAPPPTETLEPSPTRQPGRTAEPAATTGAAPTPRPILQVPTNTPLPTPTDTATPTPTRTSTPTITPTPTRFV